MSRKALVVIGVHKSFGSVEVLRGVDFHVEQDEILSLIGPNGAGKTTLFNIICGLLPPDRGSLVLDGINVEREPAYRRARLGIGRTFQLPRLCPHLNTLENVMVGAFHRDRNAVAAERGATDWLCRLGLGDLVMSDIGRLTLLQRKLTEIARAMLGEPVLLLLDEVMAGLTPAELERTIKVINDIRATGTTVLLIEHIMMAVMSLSDRVIVLGGGNIIAGGEPQQVVRDPAVLRTYLGEQYRAECP